MVDKTFEIVVGNKTYTTLKVTPILRGKLMQLLAEVRKAAFGYTQEEVEQYDWLQLRIAGALYESAPPVMWDFIRPEDKTSIGTKEGFFENLDPKVISAFFQWTNQILTETNDFLEKSQVETNPAQPSLSTPSSTSLPEDMAGVQTTANG